MKRSKIKNKYSNIIKENIEEKKEDKLTFEKTLLNISKTILLIILLLTFSAIPLIILSLFHINYDNFSITEKALYLLATDISFIFILISLYKKDITKDFYNFFDKNIINNLKISFKYWISGLIIMIISNLALNAINNGAIAGNEEAVREMIQQLPFYMIFQTIIYAPITEEIIFRKSIRNITNNKYLYIILSGLIFGGMHVIGSANSLVDALYIIPYGALGMAFAALYYKTNNIFSTITIHSFHNTLTIILYFIGTFL